MAFNNLQDVLEQYPAQQKTVKNMIEFVEQNVQLALRTQDNGYKRLYMDELIMRYKGEYGDEIDLDLLYAMLQDREEFTEVEQANEKYIIEISDQYIRKEPYKLTQGDLNRILANHLKWKYDTGGEQADFSNCVLRGLNLLGMDLRDCNCTNTIFEDCDMRNTIFTKAWFDSARFSNCDMRNMIAPHAFLYEATFQNCDLSNADLTDSTLVSASMVDCETQNTNMSGCSMRDFEQTCSDESGIMSM